ncbi:hypothetical protein EGW08_003508 [Elysia chlorotica]|uniref:Uncharacterized protein n=1 Tax=Elysia chlorotica TaxID=188477 RepID=A0A3S1BQ04_ELYCH|nr:hypothetical protein EGW08_003508 [Elysia chlorotica]
MRTVYKNVAIGQHPGLPYGAGVYSVHCPAPRLTRPVWFHQALTHCGRCLSACRVVPKLVKIAVTELANVGTLCINRKLLSPAPPAEKIFTLPSASLPSQYRSLLPARAAKAEELLRLERSSRRISKAVVALTALIVVFIVAIFSAIIATLVHYSSRPQEILPSAVSKDSYFQVDHVTTVELSRAPNSKNQPYQVQSTGSQCVERCWEFSAFKFSATCEEGRCQCHNKAYQEDSCLPIFGRCAIRYVLPGEDRQSFQVTYKGQTEPVYACSVQPLKLSSSPVLTTESRAMDRGTQGESSDRNGDSFDSFGTSRYEAEQIAMDHQRKLSSQSKNNETDSIVNENLGGVSALNHPSTPTTSTLSDLLHATEVIPRDKERTSPADFPSTDHSRGKNKSTILQQNNQQNPDIDLNLPSSGDLETTSSPPVKSGHKVHVISVHGDMSSRHHVTNVTVTSSHTQSIVLVLVSYGGRHWNIMVDDTIQVQEIVLVANHRVSACSVAFSRRRDQGLQPTSLKDAVFSPAHIPDPNNQSTSPTVSRKLLRTGYGDDRRRGNTPQLLEAITGLFGEIFSFIGSARADSITKNLNFDLT